MPPPSSRSVDARLAAASGVLRDTVGGIHNLQHLLGSVRVGPKALGRVIPDVRASCGPMITAVRELVAGAESASEGSTIPALGELLTARMTELDLALHRAKKGGLRASARLELETLIAIGVRDLDGALEIVELFVEASATGSVPVDITDVIRETAVRSDTGSGRGRRTRVTFGAPSAPVAVRMNPRVALRLVAFAVALASTRESGVHVLVSEEPAACRLSFSIPAKGGDGIVVSAPPLIDLSERCASEVARSVASTLEAQREAHTATLTFPIARGD